MGANSRELAVVLQLVLELGELLHNHLALGNLFGIGGIARRAEDVIDGMGEDDGPAVAGRDVRERGLVRSLVESWTWSVVPRQWIRHNRRWLTGFCVERSHGGSWMSGSLIMASFDPPEGRGSGPFALAAFGTAGHDITLGQTIAGAPPLITTLTDTIQQDTPTTTHILIHRWLLTKFRPLQNSY